MTVGLGEIAASNVNTGPGVLMNTQVFKNIVRVEFDFGKGILLATQTPYRLVEIQYDNINSFTFDTFTNILTISTA